MDVVEREGWLKLNLVKGIGRNRFRTLVCYFGNPQNIFSASIKEIVSIPGFDEKTASIVLDEAPNIDITQQIELVEKYRVELITLNDPMYPQILKNSCYAPPLLFAKGNFVKEDNFSIAIVGTRQTTQYGRFVCERLCTDFSKMGITVVSGMAQGIDSIAHKAAIKNGGRTIAVLGNGLDICYPAGNVQLMQEIIENGVIFSEYPMGTTPEKGNFPVRNSIIAGLSLGVVIVEAPEQSGSLITAACALEDNKHVYAVPGDINRKNSEGTNALIKQGAMLITSAYDVIEDLSHLLRALVSDSTLSESIEKKNNVDKKNIANFSTSDNFLSDEERVIFEIIRLQPGGFNEIRAAASPKISIGKLSALLVSLEVKGVITQLPGGIYSAI